MLICFTKRSAVSTHLTSFLTFSFPITARNSPCPTAVGHGYEDAGRICISKRVKTSLKCELRDMLRLTINESVAQHILMCNRGLSGVHVSFYETISKTV